MAEFSLVRPEVPDAQRNKSPELLLEGLRTGLSAFAQFAQIRRQSQTDVARIALQERMAAESHELDKRKLDMAAEMIPYQQQASEAQSRLQTEQANAYAEGVATSSQMKAESTRQKNALLKEVADNARELKLDDAHFQTKNPMEFAKNVIDFGRMYHLSPLPEVKQRIKAYRDIADSQKLFIKHGLEDETGAIKGTGTGRQVPAWRIIANVNNPDTREQTLRDLEASGYTEIVQGFQQFTDKAGKKVDVPTKTRVLKGPIKKMVEEAQTLGTPESPDPIAAVAEPAPAPAIMPDYGPIGAKIRVKSPDGKVGTIPVEQRESALSQGYEVLE